MGTNLRMGDQTPESAKILRLLKILKVPMFLFILALICSGSALAGPIVEKSHIVIIPEREIFVIEVLSFSGDNATELMLEMPENAELINISGSLNYSSVKIDGSLILFENPNVINGSHIALEYSLPDDTFKKKITLETRKLLVFLPVMVDVVDRSDNLVFRGVASLGRSNYSIFEAENLLPGEEIYLKFEEKKIAVPEETNPKFNTVFLIGVVLVIGGIILLIFTKHGRMWSIEEKGKEKVSGVSEEVKRNDKTDKKDKTKEKKGGWEI